MLFTIVILLTGVYASPAPEPAGAQVLASAAPSLIHPNCDVRFVGKDGDAVTDRAAWSCNTIDSFLGLNPQMGGNIASLWKGYEYCVHLKGGTSCKKCEQRLSKQGVPACAFTTTSGTDSKTNATKTEERQKLPTLGGGLYSCHNGQGWSTDPYGADCHTN